MTHKEMIAVVHDMLGECNCPHSAQHCYRLAATILERQKADDAALAEAINADAAAAIRSA